MTSTEEVRLLISLLHDGARGFSELAEYVQAPGPRAFLQEEGRVRAVFANELERLLNVASTQPVQSNGTATGALHRNWISLVGESGASDRSLLRTTRICEKLIVKRYRSVLALHLAEPVRELVLEQSKHVYRAQQMLITLR